MRGGGRRQWEGGEKAVGEVEGVVEWESGIESEGEGTGV